MNIKNLMIILILVTLLLALGCSKEENITGEAIKTIEEPKEQSSPGEDAIILRDSGFYPENLEVQRGSTIVWKNFGSRNRIFAIDNEDINSGTIETKGVYAYTFQSKGTYPIRDLEGHEMEIKVK